MRLESPIQAWPTRLAALAVFTFAGGVLFGQAPPMPSQHGGYGPGYPDPHAYQPMQGSFTGPYPMGQGGTCPPNGYDLMNDVGMEGHQIDQRGPHYFDVRAEAVYLGRDDTFGRDIIFTVEDVGGDVRLSSNDLEYNEEVGFRVIGRYDICPLAVFEFGYTGIYTFEDAASFTDPDAVFPDLFSPFSDFGNDPAIVSNPGGPMPESERARTHSISIESDLQTAELSYRRYWVGWVPRISGTLLAGFRYTKLEEGFDFRSQGSEPATLQPLGPLAALHYAVDADNDLAGGQVGGDIWIGLMQGLRIGSEGKVGLFANHYTLDTTVSTTPVGTIPPTLFEEFRETQPALIAEASADLVADILPSLSIRAGYEVLFMNSLVLAGENFNEGSPYNTGPVDNGLGPQRVPFIFDQADVLYHGYHLGLEYIW
jgi:hypothetical protein